MSGGKRDRFIPIQDVDHMVERYHKGSDSAQDVKVYDQGFPPIIHSTVRRFKNEHASPVPKRFVFDRIAIPAGSLYTRGGVSIGLSMHSIRTLFVLLLGLGLAACADPPAAPAPHIIVLVADDLGLDHAPCYSADTRMPYLESRCGQSLVFERAYTHPHCTASRAALMTGRHPFRHGADDVRMQAPKLPLAEVTLAELIKNKSERGYQTAGFGKWHLADDENGSVRNPNLQGFDHYAGNPRQHHTYEYFAFDWFENGQQVGPIETYKTTFLVDQVIAYFRAPERTAPQLAFVSFTNPHKPYHVPPAHLHSFDALPPPGLTGTRSDQIGPNEYRANRREPRFDPYYFAMLEALDMEVERLVDTLQNESDRPFIFVFLGDNGSAAEVFAAIDTEAVRSKATLYDGGVRVPLMIWSAPEDDELVSSRRSDRLVHLADLFPTLGELSGVDPRYGLDPEAPLDGMSFLSEVTGSHAGQVERAYAFFERGNDEVLPFAYGAVDQQGLKLILRDPERETNYSAGQLIEIYETDADPLEQRNLLETPCSMPTARVADLFEFIVTKADQNEAHSDWFDAERYMDILTLAQQVCTEIN